MVFGIATIDNIFYIDILRIFMSGKVYFISGNEGKIVEFKSFFPKLLNLDLPLKEIQSLDLKEIIEDKLEQAYHVLMSKKDFHFDAIMVEDSSLFIESLKGLPGPFIKFFLEGIGNSGIVNLVHAFSENDKSYAITYVGIKDKQGKSIFFEGRSDGKISKEVLGDNGFGWDKIFIPNGSNKTFAEMSIEEKNKFSMRTSVIRKILKMNLEFFI